MPEGHSIHRLARDMTELVGQEVTAVSPQGRFDAAEVDGARIAAVDAYGKNLLLDLASGDQLRGGQRSVHVHLGMRGKWLRFAPVTGPPLRQVRLRLSTGDVAWDLIAPSRCGLLDEAGRADLVESLGPDPLRADADPQDAGRRLRAHAGSVGAALMDQAVLAGVGNVFRAEALHRCGIAPTRPARAVSEADTNALWSVLVDLMSLAVEDGRIVTVDAADEQERRSIPEERARRVYKQQRCYDCGTTVVAEPLAGRTSYSCPRCQPS